MTSELIAQAEALCKAAESMQQASNRFHVALGNCDPHDECEPVLDRQTAEQQYSDAFSSVTRAIHYTRKAAQAAHPAEPIPVVDGSKPYYVEMPDGVRRKYLPGAIEQPAEPQGEPVAWRNCIFEGPAPPHHASWSDWIGTKPYQFVRVRSINYNDPRVAELEALLVDIDQAIGFMPKYLRERIAAALGEG